MCNLDQTFRREIMLGRGTEQQKLRIKCFQMLNDVYPVIVKMDLGKNPAFPAASTK